MENQPNPEAKPDIDPVLVFVVNGIRLSLQQNQMTREQAIEKVKSWYPNADIHETDLLKPL